MPFNDSGNRRNHVCSLQHQHQHQHQDQASLTCDAPRPSSKPSTNEFRRSDLGLRCIEGHGRHAIGLLASLNEPIDESRRPGHLGLTHGQYRRSRILHEPCRW
jgi:hypothetical protein